MTESGEQYRVEHHTVSKNEDEDEVLPYEVWREGLEDVHLASCWAKHVADRIALALNRAECAACKALHVLHKGEGMAESNKQYRAFENPDDGTSPYRGRVLRGDKPVLVTLEADLADRIASALNQQADAAAREDMHNEKQSHFQDAGHPTAPNGQCPICYSEGYEAAEKELVHRDGLGEQLYEALRQFMSEQSWYCLRCDQPQSAPVATAGSSRSHTPCCGSPYYVTTPDNPIASEALKTWEQAKATNSDGLGERLYGALKRLREAALHSQRMGQITAALVSEAVLSEEALTAYEAAKAGS